MSNHPAWCRECLHFAEGRCRKGVKTRHRDAPCALFQPYRKNKRLLSGSAWPPRWADFSGEDEA